MGIFEKKLSKLFDYQKYENEPKLQSVIDGVNNEYSGVRRLSDDELEYAAGGMGGGGSDDDPQSNGRCKEKDCGAYLQKTPFGYICPNCGMPYDKNRNPLGRGNKGAFDSLTQ